jgi:uncharacterized protein (DUF305 family)
MSAVEVAERSADVTGPVDSGPASGGGPRWGTGWLALAVAVGLVLGLAAGLLVPTLNRPGNDSPEAGFARDMSTHHAQAVEMSVIAQERATDPRVRSLAVDIALTQQAQIGMMQTWLREWKLDPTGAQPPMAWMGDEMAASVKDGLMPGMATSAEMEQLRNATGRDFDILFLELMRTHHIGGIHMAEGVLKLSDDSEVRWLAQAMVDGQKKETTLIQELLDELRQ